jgi:hypothetical protein
MGGALSELAGGFWGKLLKKLMFSKNSRISEAIVVYRRPWVKSYQSSTSWPGLD